MDKKNPELQEANLKKKKSRKRAKWQQMSKRPEKHVS